MSRAETIDRILYSMYLEQLYSKITDRIEKLILLIMFILGSSAIFSFNSVIVGIGIVILTGIQSKYKLGETSSFALAQSYQYQRLFTIEARYTDKELVDNLLDIEKEDKIPWSILQRPAILSAQHKLNVPDIDRVKLTKKEKVASFIAGGFIS